MRTRVVLAEAPPETPRRRNSLSVLPPAASWFGPRGGAAFIVVERDPPPNRKRIVVFAGSAAPTRATWIARRRRSDAGLFEDWDTAAPSRPRPQPRFVWPGGTFVLPPDLVAATILRLRSWQRGALASLLGDTGNSGLAVSNKFQSGMVTRADIPYLRVDFLFARPENNNTGGYLFEEHLQFTVVADSPALAEQLGWYAFASLMPVLADGTPNPPLVFANGTDCGRVAGDYRRFTDGGLGVGVPIVYRHVFDYVVWVGRSFAPGH